MLQIYVIYFTFIFLISLLLLCWFSFFCILDRFELGGKFGWCSGYCKIVMLAQVAYVSNMYKTTICSNVFLLPQKTKQVLALNFSWRKHSYHRIEEEAKIQGTCAAKTVYQILFLHLQLRNMFAGMMIYLADQPPVRLFGLMVQICLR